MGFRAALYDQSMPSLASTAPTGTLVPGKVSPQLPVPASIPRPEYVGKPGPREVHRVGGEVGRDHREGQDRPAGSRPRPSWRSASTSGPASPPTSWTGSATSSCSTTGAYPSTLGYRGFPKSLCTSLNEVICHGIPDSTVVQDGDILNIDITAFIGGVHGDTNSTFLVGDVDEESRLLVERTREVAATAAIKAVAPGREINVIGRAIESYAKRFGYGVVRDFTGHGVGESFHTGLIIPHYDAAPRYNTVMETGMVFTIEPMLTLGTHRLGHVGRRLDRRDPRPQAHRPVRAHPARDRVRRRDPHAALTLSTR